MLLYPLWSMASSLFSLHAWQSFSTISLQVFFGLRYSNTTFYYGIHERSECIPVDSGVTNLIHDHRSCVDFTVFTLEVEANVARCVHSSVNKPARNATVGYETFTHCRLLWRQGEKVGHELTLGLAPSTSYSIHFFTQSLPSFCTKCPYHCILFCCSTEIMLSNPSLSTLYFDLYHVA